MDKKDIIRLHSASMVEIESLRQYLEENKISAMIRNQFREGLSAGFPDGSSELVDLYVLDEDFEDAAKLLAEFKK